MKRDLDAELAVAARLDEPDGAAAPPRAGMAARRRPRRSLALLAALLLVVAAVVALVVFGFGGAAIYAMPVDELVSRRAELAGRQVRIEGELVPGSLRRREQPCEHRFLVRSRGAALAVRYAQCVVPDSFRDRPEGGVLVTLEGSLAPQGHFEASLVMAKCSSRYDPKARTMKGPG
ncbi:MAG: cytochrome c maturation protein CcmE [Deltaproteobacteria bacterium]|nr:cytochrome c maturation protein CcmE [Deltaproteobacteria bacterium]